MHVVIIIISLICARIVWTAFGCILNENCANSSHRTSCSYVHRVAWCVVARSSGMVACMVAYGSLVAYYSGSCTFVVRTLSSVLVHNDQLVVA
jgi:hypothetical protein